MKIFYIAIWLTFIGILYIIMVGEGTQLSKSSLKRIIYSFQYKNIIRSNIII